jgi:hypothetical protein
MCPACISTATVIAVASATSAGGVIAIAIRNFQRLRGRLVKRFSGS